MFVHIIVIYSFTYTFQHYIMSYIYQVLNIPFLPVVAFPVLEFLKFCLIYDFFLHIAMYEACKAQGFVGAARHHGDSMR